MGDAAGQGAERLQALGVAQLDLQGRPALLGLDAVGDVAQRGLGANDRATVVAHLDDVALEPHGRAVPASALALKIRRH